MAKESFTVDELADLSQLGGSDPEVPGPVGVFDEAQSFVELCQPRRLDRLQVDAVRLPHRHGMASERTEQGSGPSAATPGCGDGDLLAHGNTFATHVTEHVSDDRCADGNEDDFAGIPASGMQRGPTAAPPVVVVARETLEVDCRGSSELGSSRPADLDGHDCTSSWTDGSRTSRARRVASSTWNASKTRSASSPTWAATIGTGQ